MSDAENLERYHRLLVETNQAYAALRADPSAWDAELAERQVWEATIADGLECEPWDEDAGASITPPWA